jgi:hypothetical protein
MAPAKPTIEPSRQFGALATLSNQPPPSHARGDAGMSGTGKLLYSNLAKN